MVDVKLCTVFMDRLYVWPLYMSRESRWESHYSTLLPPQFRCYVLCWVLMNMKFARWCVLAVLLWLVILPTIIFLLLFSIISIAVNLFIDNEIKPCGSYNWQVKQHIEGRRFMSIIKQQITTWTIFKNCNKIR